MYETVIIIPYRNRKVHLKTFIDSTYRIFKENLKNFKLIIIEQEEGKLFNRGKILNVGFSLFKDKTIFFITHDVDICPKKSVVMDLYINKDYDALRISVPHEKSFGQICKLSHDSVFSCNGFPNYIWGWGIEDRALFYRYKILNKNISKNFSDKNNFSFLYHSSNVENYQGDKKKISNYEDYIFNCDDKNKQKQHIFLSGLNNLNYKTIFRKTIDSNIEWIKVSI